MSTLDMLAFFATPAAFLLLFSLVTYRMADEVFESWRTFSLWYLNIFTVLTLPPTASTGGSFGGFIQNWINGMLTVFLVVVFGVGLRQGVYK